MKKELFQSLKDKYPQQFEHLKRIECSDGWHNLLDNLCGTIQYHLERNKEIKFCWLQIKEKFGGLRAYAAGADDYIAGVKDMAEAMSYNICEYSGDKGKLRKQKKTKNDEIVFAWNKVLSDKEAEKEGYVIE
jgi:hypothetical protein